MKYLHSKQSGFTLIEVIVALTIFSMTMISVMTIFYLASQMSTRIELNRHMQENIKNTLDIIAEDVRQNKILGGGGQDTTCSAFIEGSSSHKLCLTTGMHNFQYTLGVFNESTSSYQPVNKNDCLDILSESCYILKTETDASGYYPLTNNKSHITRLEFRFGNEKQPKVQITLGIRPAVRQGMATHLIEAQEIIVQTTLSERYIPIITN